MGQAKRRGTLEERKALAIQAHNDELKRLDDLWDKENPPECMRRPRRTVTTREVAAIVAAYKPKPSNK